MLDWFSIIQSFLNKFNSQLNSKKFKSSNQNKLVSNGACFSLLVHSCHPVFLSSNISYSSKYYANGVEILIS